MKDFAIEIFESVKRNKLRTALAGFSVSWGIFILIVLLGAGNGLLNAFREAGGQWKSNTMMVGSGMTSKPANGYKAGRWIRMTEKDIAITASNTFADHIDQVVGTLSASGITIVYGANSISTSLEGVYPEHADMEGWQMLAGRFINKKDLEDKRKVLVLGSRDVTQLLGEEYTPESALGKRVKVNNMSFTIIGVLKSDEMSMSEQYTIPFTTLMHIFNKGKYMDSVIFSFHGLDSEEENEQFEKDYKSVLNAVHSAAPDDERAFWIWNRFTQNMKMNTASRVLTIALWIIGIFTLLSGIVGISNIMLITVKERTHEFGIRKAIGASPWSIARLIVGESVAITSVFGYVGMFLGMLACDSLSDLVTSLSTVDLMGMKMSILKDATVGLDIALEATLLLIIAGTIAGLSPALKAANVRPIEALNAR